jgi:hypothetical protein
MILVVTYELKQPATSYAQLFDVLKSKDSWAHYMPSTWFVATNESPKELYDQLANLIFQEDNILIMQLTPGYHGWMKKKAWEWVKAHL